MADNLPSINRVVFDITFLEDAYNELPVHMQNKENFVKMLLVFAHRFEIVQTEAIKMAYLRLLDNAEGVILDSIADRMFIDRSSQSDVSLRGAIKIRALRQDAEGTRDQVANLLKILSDSNQVKIFKSIKNYVEVVFPFECLTASELKASLSDLFPVNTNLVVGDVTTGLNAFGVGSVYGGTSDKIGTLGSVHDSLIDKTQSVSVMIISDERDL